MKNLNQYIQEGLKVNSKSKFKKYNYHPKTKDELREIMEQLIKERGLEANLNDIDTSEITDMTILFRWSKFNGDISNWDVSKVKNMQGMFYYSDFNGDISNWDVSNVEDMSYMFDLSKFTGNISGWDVSNVKDMRDMFKNSIFNGDLSKWPIDKNICSMKDAFGNCPLENNPPKWYKK